MKKILIAALLVVLLVCVGAAGCIGSEPIVGNWVISGTDVPVVFNGDGTGTLTISSFIGNTTVPLTWTKVADKSYKVTGTNAAFSAGTYNLSADNKALISVSTGFTVFVKQT